MDDSMTAARFVWDSSFRHHIFCVHFLSKGHREIVMSSLDYSSSVFVSGDLSKFRIRNFGSFNPQSSGFLFWRDDPAGIPADKFCCKGGQIFWGRRRCQGTRAPRPSPSQHQTKFLGSLFRKRGYHRRCLCCLRVRLTTARWALRHLRFLSL